MNAEICAYIIPFISIGVLLIALFIYTLDRYERETDDGNSIAAEHVMARSWMLLILIVILEVPLLVKVHNNIQACDEEQTRYNRAVKNGYTLYYNGQKSDADDIGITRKNIYDYDIKFDDAKKIVRVKYD